MRTMLLVILILGGGNALAQEWTSDFDTMRRWETVIGNGPVLPLPCPDDPEILWCIGPSADPSELYIKDFDPDLQHEGVATLEAERQNDRHFLPSLGTPPNWNTPIGAPVDWVLLD